MSTNGIPIGTVMSDQDTPTFETVRVKLKAGQDVRPGTLIRIPTSRADKTTLIARVRSAYEHNPNELPENNNVRDTLGLSPNYPPEEESTTIYRCVEADLIEEIIDDEIREPQSLPNSGAEVFIADSDLFIAIRLSSSGHRLRTLKLCVERGSDLDEITPFAILPAGNTSCYCTCVNGCRGIVDRAVSG